MRIRNVAFVMMLFLLCLIPVSCNKLKRDETRTETEKAKEWKKKKDKEGEEEGKKEKKEKTGGEEDVPQGLPHLLFEVAGETHIDENYHYLYTIESNKLKLKEEGKEFGALTKAIEEYNKEVEELYQKDLSDLEAGSLSSEEAKKNVQNALGNIPEIKTKSELIRADKAIVSILNSKSVDYTGSRVEYRRSAVNFDTRSGKRLSFSDVVKDADTFFGLAEKRAKESMGTEMEFPPELVGKIKEQGEELTWTVNAEGVSVYLDTYEFGRSRKEPAAITVYFDEARKIFEKRYTKTEEDYVMPLLGGMNLDLDIDGDGHREAVYLKKLSATSEEAYNSVYVGIAVVANGKKSKDVECFDGRGYIVKKSGKYYLYLFVDEIDDISLLYRIDLSTLEIREEEFWATDISVKYYTQKDDGEVGHHHYLKENFSDAAGFCGEGRNDILSTNPVEIDWILDKEAYPRPDGNRYRAIGNRVLKTLKDISAPEVDSAGKVLKEGIIPANSYLLFMYSDNESLVDMRIIDEKYVNKENWGGEVSYYNLNDFDQYKYNGPLYRIQMERDMENWITKVNGVDAEELFEGMAYAG